MPSFSNHTLMKFQLHNSVAESLQVPCNFPLNNRVINFFAGKGALPFSFFKNKRLKASMTVEAALCLPLFLFFAAALMEPMRWLDRQRKVQAAIEHFCGDLSQYVYINEVGMENGYGGDGKTPEDVYEGEYLELASDTAAGLWLKGKLKDYAENIAIKKVHVLDSSGDIWVEAEYKEKLPFFRLKEGGALMHAASKRRSWIGINGKLKLDGTDNAGDKDTEETMVYVGAGMGKYHMYRDCHYISNQYETVLLSEAKEIKNTFGGRYKACSRCAKEKDFNGSVYITSSGEHYHFSKSCSAMVSYVRSVPLSEVEHLGLCSYCAGKGKGGGKDGKNSAWRNHAENDSRKRDGFRFAAV